MNWFKRIKIGTKLVVGFAVMMLILGAVGLAAYVSLHRIQELLTDIHAVRLPSMDYLIEADRDLQQLLVAERSMIFANAKSEVFKGLVDEYEQNLQQAGDRWQKYKALAATDEELALLPQFETAREEWRVVSETIVKGRMADTREGRREALDLTLGIAKDKFEAMRNVLDQLTELNLKYADEDDQTAYRTYRQTVIALLAIIGFGLLAGLTLMITLGRGITLPLQRVIAGLSEGGEQVNSASSQVASASQSLAEGTSQQAASIEETSSSLEEMAAMTKQNADNAGQAKSMMGEAGQIVANVDKHMGDMVAAIEEITRSSEETGKIIKTIDEIAFQTNLLALNAAVEAARAGEAGAGFAVVADEVRNLAMRAADSAKNTSDLIQNTITSVKNGNELTQKTQAAFGENARIASQIGGLIDEIAAASNEQAQGIEQINTAVTEMDKVTQQNAANAEESASASEEMSAQAEQMKAFVTDLALLVGGNAGKGVKNDSESVPTAAPMTASVHRSATAKQHHARPGTDFQAVEVRKEQLIPLDDSELKDF